MLTPGLHDADAITDGIVRHLRSLIRPDGSIACQVRSRVLESALAFRLLELEETAPDQRERTRDFLACAAAEPGLSALDRTLTSALMGAPNSNSDDSEPLTEFRHHTASRKRVLVETVLHLVCGRSPSARRADEFAVADTHSWKVLEMLACRGIQALATGNETLRLREPEYDSLARAIDSQEVYDRNVLSHLLFVFALRCQAGYRRQVMRGIDALLRTQARDGGFRIATELDLCGAAECGLALTEAGQHDEGRRIADWLAYHQAPDGGWGFAVGTRQTDTDSTATCLRLFQLSVRQPHSAAVQRGVRYLLAMRNQDGGFPTYVHGNPSEPTPTGTALCVLAHGGDVRPGLPDLFDEAVRYLADSQRDDGTFGQNWNLSEACSLFRVFEGLCAALTRARIPAEAVRAAQRILQRGTDHLLATQNSDGGWGWGSGRQSDATSTGFALAALGSAAQHIHVARAPLDSGLVYLTLAQAPDGTFRSPSHELIPRPIPADVPALTHARILRGVTLVGAQGRR
ncbi:prenyltransferase/squalene oxidase repeat-containing protein [Streptomyces noursei]|uniref:prenyltransferase/squalene oxidase repeat-containing protein n=1 Tax=Streptomyces noursei TaxID=1971 RepID=UPI00380A4FCF